MRTGSRSRFLSLVVTTALVGSLVPAVADAAPGEAHNLGSRFTLAVLPDTQFYSRYEAPSGGQMFANRYGSNPFDSQAHFVVDNAKTLNIPFTSHLGDVVDQNDVADQWDIADRAMAVLENGGMNYSILPGNHDLGMNGSTSTFSSHFGTARAQKNETFGDRTTATVNGQDVESEYHIFEAEGQKYLVLALGFRAPDETLDWAQKIIDEHPDLPVILTSHEISNIDGEGTIRLTPEYGQHLWDTFIAKNDQIFLTIAGHHHGAGYSVMQNNFGHDVVTILQDYQMAYLGGNGLMGLLEFDLTGNSLDMTAFSPWVKEKKPEALTQFDHLLPAGDGDSYSVPLNFKERFAGFAPEWDEGDRNDPDYSETAKQIISAGYKPYTITEADKPANAKDYVHVDGTAVHWRPGEATYKGKKLKAGQAAPVGTIIPDVAGNSDMTRAPLRGGVTGDITYENDAHPLSSDQGSLRWSKPLGKLDVNFFETATGASINKENFPNGYTLESFIKLDKDFNGDDNGWSNALVRRGRVTDADPSNGDTDPAQMLGVSNLREIRYWSHGANNEGFSNWSHEVPTGTWMHVAIVNDPKTQSVNMYIDGAPILRDGYGPIGLGGQSTWLMGTSMEDGKPVDPWFGSIGETRIVDHPIGPDQWLTARATGGNDQKQDEAEDTNDGGSHDDKQGSSNAKGDATTSSAAGTIAGATVGGVVLGIIATLGAIAALLGTAGSLAIGWLKNTFHL
ncbi:LamG-like jellyroll fold domain-containing protein [Corynebacterium glucuronolyticum]|uniref:Metallophosphoesterase n=2 Tax=Corynebacterium glucuronolyticum TaxID=39791 RepID=A0AAX1L793_9CORY|nr:LamG-like jellyroll fold domain-containing protein [Corynebacterium glucuronolyticum]EEI62016.1 Ser/Thr phosphatase family protein [Corynebacterium glucuronolyticum ATCC 51866]QRP69744.1 metallophosphoesterase [Corynebacterium glucuronolyticum]